MKKINWNQNVNEKDFIIVISMVSILILGYFLYVTFIPRTSIIKIDIIEIRESQNLFNLSRVGNFEIPGIEINSKKQVQYNSKEAEQLIKKYNIKNVPGLIIVSRDIDKLELDNLVFNINKNYAVFDKPVPYLELSSGEIKGNVRIIEIQGCEECTSLSGLRGQLEAGGVKIEDYNIISAMSEQGKKLIEENDIEFVSSFLISKDIKEYWWMFNDIKGVFNEKDNYFVFSIPIPPYKEISTGKIKGKVNVIYLENKTCLECFNVSQLGLSFIQMGVYFNSEKTIDISSAEGKNLIKKYNITKIPTIILSKEISDYQNIREIISEVGDFNEEDKSFVFRAIDKLNVKYQEI